MPTGYTAGVVDGEIKTFPEFAKQCARAFGAMFHMRDEPMDEEYRPHVPSDYHKDQITRYEGELEHARRLTDEELLERHSEQIEESINSMKERIKTIADTRERLLDMLSQVKAWNPPTGDHREFKRFMVQQLESTIQADGSFDYYHKHIAHLRKKKDVTAEKLRADMIAEAEKNILYHKEEYAKEIKRCEKANQWVETLFESLS